MSINDASVNVLPGTHEQLFDFLSHCDRARMVPMIWGAPGIGKTDVVHAWAEEKAEKLGRKAVVWHKLNRAQKDKLYEDPEERKKFYIIYDNRAASNDSTDDKGIPNIANPEYLSWVQNQAYNIFSFPETRGLLFNDELTLAPTLVQNSMYKMVYDKSVGDISFNKHIFIACAGNRIQDKAFVQETPLPLRTRMIHFWLIQAEPKAQVEYFMKIGVDHRLIAFFSAHANLFFHYEEDSDEFTACTPRTIEFCSDLIKPLVYPEEEKVMELLACGAVSTYVGSMIMKFLKHTRSLNLDEYLRNPNLAADLADLDNKYGLVTLVVHRFSQQGKSGDIFNEAMEIFSNLDEETGILMLRMMKEKNLVRFKSGLKSNLNAVKTLQDIASIVLESTD